MLRSQNALRVSTFLAFVVLGAPVHGQDDPMVPPEQVLDFENEMSAAGADWQMHAYGGTMHAFTNPGANDPDFGAVFNPVADRRATQSIQNFWSEIFE